MIVEIGGTWGVFLNIISRWNSVGRNKTKNIYTYIY